MFQSTSSLPSQSISYPLQEVPGSLILILWYWLNTMDSSSRTKTSGFHRGHQYDKQGRGHICHLRLCGQDRNTPQHVVRSGKSFLGPHPGWLPPPLPPHLPHGFLLYTLSCPCIYHCIVNQSCRNGASHGCSINV